MESGNFVRFGFHQRHGPKRSGPVDDLWTLAGASPSATIILEIAGYADQNKFGLYDPSNPGNTQAQVFSGPDSAGATVLSQVHWQPAGEQS